MKKKVTNEDVGTLFKKVADQVKSEMDYDFRVAQSQMYLAENDLIETLDENQKKLYRDYLDKRDVFYAIAKELYVRKF